MLHVIERVTHRNRAIFHTLVYSTDAHKPRGLGQAEAKNWEINVAL